MYIGIKEKNENEKEKEEQDNEVVRKRFIFL